jgi:DNA-binding CsgD family transcriptional regulator
VSVMVMQAKGGSAVLDSDPERARTAFRTIESSGRQAIEELRLMLGLLRDGGASDEADRSPQPGLARLPALLDSIRSAGLAVELREEGEPARLPAGEDVSAYRIVQESGGPGARPHRPADDPRRRRRDRSRRRGRRRRRRARPRAPRNARRRADGHPHAGRRRIEATCRLAASGSPARVIVLTTFDLDEHVQAALRAGASGFLVKDGPAEEMLTAMRVVAAGESLLSPSVTRRVIADLVSRPERSGRPPALEELTPREEEVLRLLARGRSNAEIAGELVVSHETVKSHVARILMKLGARDRGRP